MSLRSAFSPHDFLIDSKSDEERRHDPILLRFIERLMLQDGFDRRIPPKEVHLATLLNPRKLCEHLIVDDGKCQPRSDECKRYLFCLAVGSKSDQQPSTYMRPPKIGLARDCYFHIINEIKKIFRTRTQITVLIPHNQGRTVFLYHLIACAVEGLIEPGLIIPLTAGGGLCFARKFISYLPSDENTAPFIYVQRSPNAPDYASCWVADGARHKLPDHFLPKRKWLVRCQHPDLHLHLKESKFTTSLLLFMPLWTIYEYALAIFWCHRTWYKTLCEGQVLDLIALGAPIFDSNLTQFKTSLLQTFQAYATITPKIDRISQAIVRFPLFFFAWAAMDDGIPKLTNSAWNCCDVVGFSSRLAKKFFLDHFYRPEMADTICGDILLVPAADLLLNLQQECDQLQLQKTEDAPQQRNAVEMSQWRGGRSQSREKIQDRMGVEKIDKESEDDRDSSDERQTVTEGARKSNERAQLSRERAQRSSEEARDCTKKARDTGEEARDSSGEARNISEEARDFSEGARDISEEARDVSDETGGINEKAGGISEGTGERRGGVQREISKLKEDFVEEREELRTDREEEVKWQEEATEKESESHNSYSSIELREEDGSKLMESYPLDDAASDHVERVRIESEAGSAGVTMATSEGGASESKRRERKVVRAKIFGDSIFEGSESHGDDVQPHKKLRRSEDGDFNRSSSDVATLMADIEILENEKKKAAREVRICEAAIAAMRKRLDEYASRAPIF